MRIFKWFSLMILTLGLLCTAIILIIKWTRCTNSQIYFWNKTLHTSDSSSVHHQVFFTVHTAMVYVIQVCWQFNSEQDQDGTAVPSWSCSQAVWHIPLLCVQWKIPDDGQTNCPKYVEFYSEKKFEKLVHVVGFVIRIPWWYFYTRTDDSSVSCYTYNKLIY